ncbi:MAG: hypothetical protein RBR58_04320, partial [Candidatus Humimicrobiaceae bacterium]|nr:hypothetical protein [Candidatus Humimicrobiaceae bacterium]
MKDNKKFDSRVIKNIALLVLLIVVMFLVLRNPMFLSQPVKEFNMNEFVEAVEQGQIDTSTPVVVKGEDKIVEGELKDGTKFTVSFLEDYDITKLLLDNNLPFKVDNQKQSIWIQILVSIIPFIIMIGLFFFM